MFKRTLLLLLTFVCFCSICLAQKREWKDKQYDYRKAEQISIMYDTKLPLDAIATNETIDIYSKKSKELAKQLLSKNYRLYDIGDIGVAIAKDKSIDFEELLETNNSKALSMVNQYINENIDIFLKLELLMYDTGTQYCEGFFYTVPSTTHTTIYTPNGIAHATTDKESTRYSPGGNFPTAYCVIKMSMFDVKSKKLIWERIDDRAKVNRLVFENTTPKDMFKRIINDMLGDVNDVFSKKEQRFVVK